MFNWKMSLAVPLFTVILAACGQQSSTPLPTKAQKLLPCVATAQSLRQTPADDCPPTEPDPDPSGPENSATLTPGAVILDNAVVSYDYDSGTLILNQTPVTSTYVVGNTVIGDITPGARAGVPPRHITSIANDGQGHYVLSTSEAALSDVVSDATLNYSKTFTNADPSVTTYPNSDDTFSINQTGSMRALSNDPKTCDTEGMSILNFSYEKKFDNNSLVSGCLDAGIALNLQLRISHWKTEYFEASVKLTDQAKLNIKAAADAGELKFGRSWPIMTKTFGPMTVWIGPVPLVIAPYIDIIVGIDGSVIGTVNYSIYHNTTYRAGLKYADDHFSPINERGGDTSLLNPLDKSSLSVKASAKAYIDVTPGIQFFTTVGVAHAKLNLNMVARAYAKLDIDPMRRPNWQITAGPQFCVGARFELTILFGLYDNAWANEKCGAEIRMFELHSADVGPTVPGWMNSWQKVELNFTINQGAIEVYKLDGSGNTILVGRLDSSGKIDITSSISSYGDDFIVVAVAKRTSGIFGSYSYDVGMKAYADGYEIWHPNNRSDSHTNSTRVYAFTIDKGNAILTPNNP